MKTNPANLSPGVRNSSGPDLPPGWRRWLTGLAGFLGMAAVLPAQGDAAGPAGRLPVDCGKAVVTHYSGQDAVGVNTNGFVVGLVDLRDPALNGAVAGSTWNAARFHNETGGPGQVWNAKNLGQVFGVVLDDAASPNIYVTAASIYGTPAAFPLNYGPGGPGAVYRLDGTTGAISVFAMLPNALNTAGRAPSLGNICYDRRNRQFFVSNFEDGLIYRLDLTGAWLAAIPYDHGTGARPNEAPRPALPDPKTPGTMTPPGRRVWGLNVFDNRLYYAVWSEDAASPSPAVANEIWSVGLDMNGAPQAPGARLEFALPPWVVSLAGDPGLGQPAGFSSPVSDISFTETGRMLLAERSMPFGAHRSRVLEYQLDMVSGKWLPAAKTFRAGVPAAPDSMAGGADFTCDGDIWATGDLLGVKDPAAAGAMRRMDGLTWISGSGNTIPTMNSASWFVDLDGLTGDPEIRAQAGDVAVNRDCCLCAEIRDVSVRCQQMPPPAAANAYQWTFQITNTMPWPIGQVTFLQSPGFTVTPGPIHTLPVPLMPGNSTNVTVTLTPSGNTLPDHACLQMILHSPKLDYCCELLHCVELEECCAEVGKLLITRDDASPTGSTLTLNYQNLAANPVSWIFIVPAPASAGCFTPVTIPVIPPLAYGQSQTFSLPVTIDPACREICLIISGHSADFRKCCSVTRCVEVPCDCKPKTWTLDADFDLGTLINVNHNPSHQLQLNPVTRPLPYVCIPCSIRGTVVRIDINGPNSSAAVLGEYLSAPASTGNAAVGRNPSRTTVDKYGNVWVGNRDSTQKLDGSPSTSLSDAWGSVVRIGLVIGGTRGDVVAGVFTPNPLGSYLKPPFAYSTCVDRDGDGYIKTSRGLGHILPWNNAGSVDTDGGVQTAEDECITIYTRVPGSGTRFLAIDCDNNLWTSGNNFAFDPINSVWALDAEFQAVDGVTGNLIPGTFVNHGAGGYGGLIDGFGDIWGGNSLVRFSSQTLALNPLTGSNNWVYGIGIDPRSCHVFTSMTSALDQTNTLRSGIVEWDPMTGGILYDYPAQTGSGGICVDGSGHVWSAASNAVYHLTPNGPPGSGHTVQPPVAIPPSPNPINPGSSWVWGVAVDANGHIWASDQGGNSTHRINPGLNAVDKTIDLGSASSHPSGLDAGPYNYSDMTGFVALGATCREGSWTILHDGGCPGSDWGRLTWTALNTDAFNTVTVEIRADDSPVLLPTHPFVPVSNGQDFCGRGITGRWVEIRVTLHGKPCTSESPVLADLTLECCEEDHGTGEGHPPKPVKCPEDMVVMPVNGAASVTLSVTLTDPDFENISVQWKEGATVLFSEVIPASGPPSLGTSTLTAVFPPGPHVITVCALVNGAWAVMCEVTVTVGDMSPPVFGPVAAGTSNLWESRMPDLVKTAAVTDNITPSGQLVRGQSPPAGTLLHTGRHAVTLTARDAAGNTGKVFTSFTVSPKLNLTSPANYGVFSAGETVNLEASMEKTSPEASGFAFLVNGVVKYIAAGAARSVSLPVKDFAPGNYTVQAVAYGPSGSMAYSGFRTIAVRGVAGDSAIQGALQPTIEIRGGAVCICVPTVPGEICCVESSTDLQHWVVVPNGTIVGSGTVQEIIVPGGAEERTFYRVNRDP